jgi:hypothetical protein
MPATERAGRSVLRAAFAAAAVLAAAELAATATQPRLPSAAEDGLLRNPHYARGWTEYTRPAPAGAAARGAPLVVAITNSQGFLRERADPREAWPHRLADELAALGAPARVLNWAAPGGNGGEMTVLAARARAHAPAAIVLVSYGDNFGPYWRERDLAFGYTDVHLLAYLPAVRAHLTAGFLAAADAYDPLGWLGAHSALSWRRNRWSDAAERWTFRVSEPRHPSGPPAGARFGIGDVRDFGLLDDFLHAAGAREAAGPAVLVVGMPLCEEACDDWARVGEFAAAAAEKVAGLPRARALDASAVVPSAEFYGPRHLRPAGHQRFAAWLAPRVRALLAGE